MALTELDYTERNVVDPSGIVQVFCDYWWICAEGDPKRAMFYTRGRGVGSPQCNANKAIMETLATPLRAYGAAVEIIQIPLAFVPWED